MSEIQLMTCVKLSSIFTVREHEGQQGVVKFLKWFCEDSTILWRVGLGRHSKVAVEIKAIVECSSHSDSLRSSMLSDHYSFSNTASFTFFEVLNSLSLVFYTFKMEVQRQLCLRNKSLVDFVPWCANCTNVSKSFVEHTIKARPTILQS